MKTTITLNPGDTGLNDVLQSKDSSIIISKRYQTPLWVASINGVVLTGEDNIVSRFLTTTDAIKAIESNLINNGFDSEVVVDYTKKWKNIDGSMVLQDN